MFRDLIVYFGIMLMVVGFFIFGYGMHKSGFEKGFAQGQISAIKGEVKFDLTVRPDSVWEKTK